MEFHVKNETNGLNNGVAQVWVDGVQRLNVTNIDFKGSNGFNGFELPENHQFRTLNPAVDMYQDLDDVVVSATGPIGCP
jgi:hypothetical protein